MVKWDSETGKALGEILSGRDVSQSRLARLTARSQPYVNQVVNGKRHPSAEWIETMANALALEDTERERLHRAAAKDHGFRIDLTKP